jgi:hypothetical protein
MLGYTASETHTIMCGNEAGGNQNYLSEILV